MKNCEFGNKSSILVSDNKQMSVLVTTKCSDFISNRIDVKYQMITFLGWFECCFYRPFNVSQGASEDIATTDFSDSLFCLLE